ncbi:MAG: hypothetical protein JWM80_1715 [Cyanobacteria bacterium RYN_339]|nr:hypothetical protein [Cyanobacteria bacterium RYN_339]
MSHFTVVRTTLRDEAMLCQALADLGFPVVEAREEAQPLFGYQGDQRDETAEVILRREFVNPGSNDIGFKRNADGNFDAIISEFDSTRLNATWLGQLSQRYALAMVKATMAKQGYLVDAEQLQANGSLRVVARKFG